MGALFCVDSVFDGIQVTEVRRYVVESTRGGKRGVYRARMGDIDRKPIFNVDFLEVPIIGIFLSSIYFINHIQDYNL